MRLTTLIENKKMPPDEINDMRHAEIHDIHELAESLKGENERLLETLHPDVRAVVQNKNIALLLKLFDKPCRCDNTRSTSCAAVLSVELQVHSCGSFAR